ncbi:transcriptional regulator, partial [Escherichia coli]|nr:transcriptional regulator [Escherichia coli]
KQATVSNFENHPEKTTLTTVFKILQSLELSMAICEKNAPDSGNNRDNPQDLDW